MATWWRRWRRAPCTALQLPPPPSPPTCRPVAGSSGRGGGVCGGHHLGGGVPVDVEVVGRGGHQPAADGPQPAVVERVTEFALLLFRQLLEVAPTRRLAPLHRGAQGCPAQQPDKLTPRFRLEL